MLGFGIGYLCLQKANQNQLHKTKTHTHTQTKNTLSFLKEAISSFEYQKALRSDYVDIVRVKMFT
jgi:hypothetical protein